LAQVIVQGDGLSQENNEVLLQGGYGGGRGGRVPAGVVVLLLSTAVVFLGNLGPQLGNLTVKACAPQPVRDLAADRPRWI